MLQMNHAHFNMVHQQIRPWEVLDPQVINALEQTPRENFVPPEYRHLAYAELDIPLAHEQHMMLPMIAARILQSLNLNRTDTVLEIGTGSGFVTALLAHLAKYVYSVDIYPEFVDAARKRLAALGINNVNLESGDAAHGWDRHAPYDVIVLTGSVEKLPEAFRASLKIDGRLFAVIGTPPVMEATLFTRIEEHVYAKEEIFETVLPPLVSAKRTQLFRLD